ncbi:hypothetical protein PMAYCL1PPCAC_30946, partial [Pristionchus mayeri]
RILLLLLSSSLAWSISLEDESDLPVYLQGIRWQNVEAELRKDLRLTPFVRPLHYNVSLNVNVAGYNGAQSSYYDGIVIVTLNITAPVNEIEIHSLGLTISKVSLEARKMSKLTSLNDGKFHIRQERETIAIPSNRIIIPGEDVVLTITFNGTARNSSDRNVCLLQ